MQVLGDQPIMMQAVETGSLMSPRSTAFLAKNLRQKGFTVLGESANLTQRTVGQAMVAPQTFLSQRPDVVENYLKAEIDALAFSIAPKNKATVIRTIMKRLKANANDAEEGYQDLLKGVDRKPFPSLDGLRNVQRTLKTRNPKIGEIKTEEVIDARIMRKLDDSGFIDRAYAAQGVSLK